MKILLVEDEPDLLEIFEHMLSSYEIIKACDGREAIEKFKSHQPDLVLMDIELPGIDGVEATKRILSIKPDTKVIAITAFASRRGREMLAAGAVEVLKKPFRMQELLETVRKYL
ncbi:MULTISPECIES: response regulator [unclassified Archaeoglobus]|jgi:CheY-like chemotaxis protein|uniref:response regulator n=1 Tax=unclassified Archaeoglobus TaxID=2643606 RepID=UPI0025C67899|nr:MULTISPECIES: response regulator [unclassified Archaeoglobus]